MNNAELSITRQDLTQLMAVATDRDSIWLVDELPAVWQHQLQAPLRLDLARLSEMDEATVSELCQGSQIVTFGDLLQHRDPPLELLRLTKELAKAARNDDGAELPQPIATALYYAAIIVARLRCGQTITSIDAGAIRRAIEWVMAQPWLDRPTAELFEQGLEVFR